MTNASELRRVVEPEPDAIRRIEMLDVRKSALGVEHRGAKHVPLKEPTIGPTQFCRTSTGPELVTLIANIAATITGAAKANSTEAATTSNARCVRARQPSRSLNSATHSGRG